MIAPEGGPTERREAVVTENYGNVTRRKMWLPGVEFNPFFIAITRCLGWKRCHSLFQTITKIFTLSDWTSKKCVGGGGPCTPTRIVHSTIKNVYVYFPLIGCASRRTVCKQSAERRSASQVITTTPLLMDRLMLAWIFLPLMDSHSHDPNWLSTYYVLC